MYTPVLLLVNLFLTYHVNGLRQLSFPRINRLPLCMVHNTQSQPQGNISTPSTFLVLPEKAALSDEVSRKQLTIGNHVCDFIQGPLPDDIRSPTQKINTIHAVRNSYKIGKAALATETIFDKRRNHCDLVELAKMILKADGIIVPVEYDQLMSKGRLIYPLQLLDTISFLLRQVGTPRLNVHVIIYNKEMGQCRESISFYRDQEHEIKSTLYNVFQQLADFIEMSFTFTDKTTSDGYIPAAHKWITDKIDLRLHCPNEISQEFRAKAEVIQKLSSLQQHIKASVNDVGINLKHIDLSSDSVTFSKLLDIANAVEQKLNNWMQQNATALSEVPNDLKTHVDMIIDTVFQEFDSALASLPKRTEVNRSKLRQNIVDSVQNKLMFMMDSVILKLQDKVMQEFQKDLQTLPVDPNLDINLQDKIGKYDRNYCSLVDQCMFANLKGNVLYEIKLQMHRRDLVENMKEVANHVLEYAIMKGLFHAKFSIVDGIAYLPSNPFTRWITKWISKLKVPLHISLNYLSPTAFGISNWFRRRIPLKPGILRYFTGEKQHKLFSDKNTRDLANSLVHKPE
ncbi:ribosomal protein S15 domain-containing, putative [Babesia ovis]|uniref:Ribosomal protein S15 domain-containing, putative n=1 Tax=Babesia ovis TaxID=5869 RepID=A0A9W5T8W3_BABOV|nr:ribosomal protein S15 domain-containing, putative [Babesia ovis]